MTISAVLNVKNEEVSAARAIASVIGWVDEVLVADMHSTDQTRQVAAAAGARVMTVPDFGYVEPARALAIDSTASDWILVLDADELIPPTLARRLESVALNDEADVVFSCRYNYFMGEPLLHSGWGMNDERHPRFFKRGVVAFPGLHRTSIQTGARRLDLPPRRDLAILHFNYEDFSQFLAKLDRYTEIEARDRLDDSRLGGQGRVVLRAARKFTGRYLRRKGYSDGYRGLALAWMMATQEIVVWAKANQYRQAGDRAAVRRRYEQVAAEVLGGSWPVDET